MELVFFTTYITHMMDMRFGIGMWNIQSLYWDGSRITVTKAIPKYKLGLVGVQQVQ
jgi:hypothetical protein